MKIKEFLFKVKKRIPIILIITILIIPSIFVYAFYYLDYESSIISKFIINANLSTSYVRSTVITYWVDLTSCSNVDDATTCDITGKSSWNMKPEVINSDWVLLEDGYYYYKTYVNANEINNDNVSDSEISIIDSELSFEELTDEYLTGTEIIPQYEVIYEFIEVDSVETAWLVSYESGNPLIIEKN